MAFIRQIWQNLGLWPRMALTVSAGFVVLFVAISLLGERAMQDSADRINDELMVVARMTAAHFESMLNHGRSELNHAHRLADFDATDPDVAAELRVLSSFFYQDELFGGGLLFLSPQGQVVAAFPENLYPAGQDLSLELATAALQSEGDFVLSEPFREPLANLPVAALTVPVLQNGQVVGLVSGLINISGKDVMEPLVAATSLGQTGHATLTDAQGRAIASTTHPPVPFMFPGEHPHFYVRAMAQGQETVETVPFEIEGIPDEPAGHLHVMAFVPLKTAPWGVAVGGDEDEAFAGLWRLRSGLILLAVVALAVVLGVTLLSARQIVRPVQGLTAAAQRIARGDLDTPIGVTGRAELGKMSAALESMRKQLMANIKQLAGLNEMLQTQVNQQSDELHRQQFVLDSIDQTVHAPLDVREMLEQILTQTRQAGPVAQGAIYLFDAHGEHLQPVTFQGMTLGQVLQLQNVVQEAILQQKPRYLSELASELLPENIGSVLAIPLTCVDGSVVGGFLLTDPHPNRFSVRQITLLSTIAGQTALIVQNSRLYGQLESQAIVEERGRLSREIHDGLVQTLGYLKMQVARMQGWLAEENTDRVRREMVNLEDVLEEVYAEARDAVVGLRVGVSPGDTLESLLTEYVQSFSARYELPVELTVNGQSPGVADTTILHLIRITQEGLTNIRRHAKASRAWVQIDYQPTLLTLLIGDDGHGFDPAANAQNGASGVQFMRERAAELSGSLEITTRSGHGTEIRVTVPIEGIRPAEPALG